MKHQFLKIFWKNFVRLPVKLNLKILKLKKHMLFYIEAMA